jgi:hypothetical protein
LIIYLSVQFMPLLFIYLLVLKELLNSIKGASTAASQRLTHVSIQQRHKV